MHFSLIFLHLFPLSCQIINKWFNFFQKKISQLSLNIKVQIPCWAPLKNVQSLSDIMLFLDSVVVFKYSLGFVFHCLFTGFNHNPRLDSSSTSFFNYFAEPFIIHHIVYFFSIHYSFPLSSCSDKGICLLLIFLFHFKSVTSSLDLACLWFLTLFNSVHKNQL